MVAQGHTPNYCREMLTNPWGTGGTREKEEKHGSMDLL